MNMLRKTSGLNELKVSCYEKPVHSHRKNEVDAGVDWMAERQGEFHSTSLQELVCVDDCDGCRLQKQEQVNGALISEHLLCSEGPEDVSNLNHNEGRRDHLGSLEELGFIAVLLVHDPLHRDRGVYYEAPPSQHHASS